MLKGIRVLSVLLALGLLFTGAAQTANPPAKSKAPSKAAKQATKTSPPKSGPQAAAPTSSTPKAATSAGAVSKKSAASAKAKAPAKTAAKSKTSTSAARRNTRARPAIQQQPTPERYWEIQQALIDRGFLQGEPTGRWDSASMEALKRFQADQQLTPTGKIDALSLIRLGLGPKRQNLAAGSLVSPSAEAQSKP